MFVVRLLPRYAATGAALTLAEIDAMAREKLPLLASARAQIFPVAWHRYAVHDRKHPLATREECAIF